GGGEILVDRVRQRISPLKAMSDDWLEVMAVAHRLGLASTATMMFGHVETVEERIEHLERVRAQQDKSRAGVSPAQTMQATVALERGSNNTAETTALADGTPALNPAGGTPAALCTGFTAFIAWTF